MAFNQSCDYLGRGALRNFKPCFLRRVHINDGKLIHCTWVEILGVVSVCNYKKAIEQTWPFMAPVQFRTGKPVNISERATFVYEVFRVHGAP